MGSRSTNTRITSPRKLPKEQGVSKHMLLQPGSLGRKKRQGGSTWVYACFMKDLKDLGIRMSTVVKHIREGMHSPLDTQQ